jgi:hypothetical protein
MQNGKSFLAGGSKTDGKPTTIMPDWSHVKAEYGREIEVVLEGREKFDSIRMKFRFHTDTTFDQSLI